MPGVFAGGDAVKAPGAIIHAIGAGRQAASSIDKQLGGNGDIDEVLFASDPPSQHIGRIEGFADFAREAVPAIPVKDRRGFTEVALGFDQEQAQREASRCLQCDLRLLFSKPVLPPRKQLWFELTQENVADVPKVEGVYQLLDEQEKVIYIKGAMNLRREIEEQLEVNEAARYFMYNEEPMYTKRESELLQQYIAEHGEMPEGNRDLDDLF